MGCVSSKLFKKDLKQEILLNNGGDYINHVVSLTSSTYGALKLDKEQNQQPPTNGIVGETKVLSKKSSPRQEREVINSWELMKGLEDNVEEEGSIKAESKKNGTFLRGFANLDVKTPLKFLHQMGSPRKAKSTGGKENRGSRGNNRGRENDLGCTERKTDFVVSKEVLKPRNSSERLRKFSPSLRVSPRSNWAGAKIGDGLDSRVLSRRRSLGPLFDPVLIESCEKEFSNEEHIKRVVSPHIKSRKPEKASIDSDNLLKRFTTKCPPNGENSVVMYTTTLRGIRKTFEDCNNLRFILESYQIQMFERDISMDCGFKEELRKLMGTKEVKVPLLFVKGRLIGGVDVVAKMDEEDELENLFNGIPPAVCGCCEDCAGVRFVMCLACYGSCKVLDEAMKKYVKCGLCNENGLIQCPICC